MKSYLKLSIGLLSVGLMSFSFVAFLSPQPPQTVVFDLKGTLDSYQQKLIDAELSDCDHREQLAQFDRQLRQLLNEYAQIHNLTIVVPAAVISGAPDMTAPIQHYIIEELKHHKNQAQEK